MANNSDEWNLGSELRANEPSLDISNKEDLLRSDFVRPEDEEFEGISVLEDVGPRGMQKILPGEDFLSLAAPVSFEVEPSGEPQDTGTRYYVVDRQHGRRFYVGRVTRYCRLRGLSRISAERSYDRFSVEQMEGLWAHFIWPTVIAEGRGRLIAINAYDRARFTWGFYQLAAHLADANFVLLMRELVQLESANAYFPDLILRNGKLIQRASVGEVELERRVFVPRYGEWQIPDFMNYLNPSSTMVENGEVITCAKMIDWARSDPRVLEKTTKVSIDVMKSNLRSRVAQLDLTGLRPELVIWVSDILHQGRGRISTIREALNEPNFEQQLEALYDVDFTGNHLARRNKVKELVQVLIDERRFDGVRFNEGRLSLP